MVVCSAGGCNIYRSSNLLVVVLVTMTSCCATITTTIATAFTIPTTISAIQTDSYPFMHIPEQSLQQSYSCLAILPMSHIAPGAKAAYVSRQEEDGSMRKFCKKADVSTDGTALISKAPIKPVNTGKFKS